ncbi:hypothetical protein PHISCL_09906 [Aspergillus sclerotialis]|uniref:Uncharacterized protein n=1 Tax=Aspergillus sclerotialis TaxID=2070753 RepID=A0A3A2Z900_9EURO|nr:hypothetical protein PHISCL_09906 [Aspergillus sclerotialis]
MDPLLWDIKRPLSNHERSMLKPPLFKTLWDFLPAKSDFQSSNALLDHYFDQLNLAEGYNLDLRTHEDVVQLIQFLKNNKTLRCELLHLKLTKELGALLGPAQNSAEKAIELAIRIWLMLTPDGWDGNKSLENFVHDIFPRDGTDTPGAMFPTAINAYELERIGGFDIVWTDNIRDHLSLFMNHGQKELRIFHLTSFLRIYKCSSESHIYPSGLLDETERAIALILPSTNIQCRKWIRKAREEDSLDLEAGTTAVVNRNLESYEFWRPRLLAVIEEYDRTEPTSLKQWAVDKRRPNQRYTFWIAATALALALVFGLIQSVTGILQVIVAMESH